MSIHGRDSPPPREPSPEPSFVPLSAMPPRRKARSRAQQMPYPQSTKSLHASQSLSSLTTTEKERKHRELMNKLDGLSASSSSPPSTPRSLPITLSPPSSPARSHRKTFSSAIPRSPILAQEEVPPVPPLPVVYTRARTVSACSSSTCTPRQPRVHPVLLPEVEPMPPLPPAAAASSEAKSIRRKFSSKLMKKSATSTRSASISSESPSMGMTCARFFSLSISRPIGTVSAH